MSPILPSAIKNAEYARRRLCAAVGAGVPYEDILEPGYWQHVHSALSKAGHEGCPIIEAMPLDNSWYAELIVVSSSKAAVKVKELKFVRLSDNVGAEDASESGGLSIAFGGPAHKWRIMRGKDVVEHGFSSRDEAEAYADELQKEAA